VERRDIVLVVDDSPETLGVLNDTLEDEGFTVLVAQSAAAALDIVGRVTTNIVLMDAIMPDMEGFAACRRLKGLPGFADIPVLFMTGLTETEHVLRALEAGGVDYVTKPVAPAEVVARIRVHLSNARLALSARAALDVAGRFLLAVDRRGHVRWTTPQAVRLLGLTPGRAMPEAFLPWLTACLNAVPGRAASGLAPPALRVPAASGAGDAELVFIGQVDAEEILLRVVASDPTSPEDALRVRFGLTAREAEVLLWLGAGKANRDIAEILGLSPRTVNKHLEQVYAKLGVENRASAAALVERTLNRRR